MNRESRENIKQPSLHKIKEVAAVFCLINIVKSYFLSVFFSSCFLISFFVSFLAFFLHFPQALPTFVSFLTSLNDEAPFSTERRMSPLVTL